MHVSNNIIIEDITVMNGMRKEVECNVQIVHLYFSHYPCNFSLSQFCLHVYLPFLLTFVVTSSMYSINFFLLAMTPFSSHFYSFLLFSFPPSPSLNFMTSLHMGNMVIYAGMTGCFHCLKICLYDLSQYSKYR
jgi:hypothetical protein